MVQIQTTRQRAAGGDFDQRFGVAILREATVATITSTIRSIPTEVLLSYADSMKTACVINLDHVQTVSKSKLGALITKLSEAKMSALKPSLLFAFGFDD